MLTKTELDGLHVTEGVSGTWFYHLSMAGTNSKGLCGARTMNTGVPLSAWGSRGHLKERYCAECEASGKDVLRAAGALLGE